MSKYQVASQRAAGATSRSPRPPNGAVSPAGSKARQPAARPNHNAPASPATHTTARQVLANSVAGVMLAITQPLRIGDRVRFEGEDGTVEDVQLNYTYLRTPVGTRVVIPNERLAAGILHNDTMGSHQADVEVSVWLTADADVDTALAEVTAIPGATG